MKRYIFGLLASIIAFGGSALTNEKPRTNQAIAYYILTINGTYVRTNITPNTNAFCISLGAHKCWIGYSHDHGLQLDRNALPDSVITESPFNGFYLF